MMIYAVKTLKSDVICVMLFNIVYNFAETFQNHLKTVLQCLNGDFNTGYKIYVICVWVPSDEGKREGHIKLGSGG